MKERSIFVASLVCLLCGCSNQSIIDTVENDSRRIVIAEDDFIHMSQITEIKGDVGKYSAFFDDADATVRVFASRMHPLAEEMIAAFYDPVDAAQTKSCEEDVNVFIDGNNLFTSGTKAQNGSITELFGRTVMFGIGQHGFGQTKAECQGSSVELYAPSIVGIEVPCISSEEDQYPLCYFKDFTIRWNKDCNNLNGVLIIIRWNGVMAFGSDYPTTNVTRVVCFPDEGVAVLDDSIFDDIPDTAICNVIVLRGDVDTIRYNDSFYRMVAESHDMMDIVLIRNIVNEN